MSDNEEVEVEAEAVIEEIVEEEEDEERQVCDPQLMADNLSVIQLTAGKYLII